MIAEFDSETLLDYWIKGSKNGENIKTQSDKPENIKTIYLKINHDFYRRE